jgi:iron complex transport system substrate-binding protein
LKKLQLFSAFTLAVLLSACSGGEGTERAELDFYINDSTAETTYQTVAVCSESLADLWLLAGGKLAAATDDCFNSDYGLKINENETLNLGSVKTPNVESLVSLNPDLVIMSETIAEQVELKEIITQSGIKTKYFRIETFEDYLSALKFCTDITRRPDLYDKNGLEIKAEIDALISANSFDANILMLRAQSTKIEVKSSDSVMTGIMLKDLGCTNIADSENSLLEELNIEVIIAKDPDIIFVTTMGDTQAARDLMSETLAQPAWQSLRAVKEDRVFILDKALFHLKPNERWAESYQCLIDILGGEIA